MAFMLSVIYPECRKQTHNVECHYGECRYAECRDPNQNNNTQNLAECQ
jgi:hypothetical protein